MSREAIVNGVVSGAGGVAGRVAAERVLGVEQGSAEEKAAAEVAQPFVSDVLSVVNMTSYNQRIIRQFNNLNASLSEPVRDRLQAFLQPTKVKKAFLGMNTQRWTFRFPNLKDQSAIARTSRYYHTQSDQRFRELYVTCADFAINCFAHERTRIKKKLKFRRKNEEINNRKVFFVSQLMNVLFVAFDDYKSSSDKAQLVANLRQILEFCQGVIDQCESGEKIWRSGGERVSFPGTLQQINHILHTAIREYERPELPSPVEATEKLISSLDDFSEASLMMVLSHILDKHLPMNAVFLQKKLHHIAMLAEAGDPLYEVPISDDTRTQIIKRCNEIEAIDAAKRTISQQLYHQLFRSITAECTKFNERQMIYCMLIERDAEHFDTPAHNRRELEPLLEAFRSDDADEQAMLYRLLSFVGSDFRDLSYAVYDFNRIPTEFRQNALRSLGLSPLRGLPGVRQPRFDRLLGAGVGAIETKGDTDSAAAIEAEATRVLDAIDKVVETPVDHVQERLKLFMQWIELNKAHPIGIIKQLSSHKSIERVLDEYRASVNDMILAIKQIEKVVATLQVAVSLFKNLSQADINSLSTVLHSVIQLAEEAIHTIDVTMRKMNRSGDHSYVNTLIQNTMHAGKRLSSTRAWHDNLVRVNHYTLNAQVAKMTEHINQLKRALTRAPDEHMAVRIGLFLKGASSLFGMQLALPSSLTTLMQNQAMRELSGAQPVVTLPVSVLDDIKHVLQTVKAEPEAVVETRVEAKPERKEAQQKTRATINAVSRFFEYALRSYGAVKQSKTGMKRANGQVRQWLADLSFGIQEDDDANSVLKRWFDLLQKRIKRRVNKSILPGVVFNLDSFELHMLLLISPYMELPAALRSVSDSTQVPRTHFELMALCQQLYQQDGRMKRERSKFAELLPFSLSADYFDLERFIATSWQEVPLFTAMQKGSRQSSVVVSAGLFASRRRAGLPESVHAPTRSIRAAGLG